MTEEINPSVERGDTDPEGVKNQISDPTEGANSTVEMVAPPVEPPLVP